jgi:hypothetical protein
MTNPMVSEHDCATGITTEREMTAEEIEQMEKNRELSLQRAIEEDTQTVAANTKLQGTREKFLAMGLTQEEIDLIVPADEEVYPMEALVE